jgi:hypothetical protein
MTTLNRETYLAAMKAEFDECWPFLVQFVQARGYVVLGCNSREPIGTIYQGKPGQRWPQPFRIVSETTAEDWMAQAELLGVDNEGEAAPYTFFYRLITE